jgi:putative transposase
LACEILGLSERTLQRWENNPNVEDRRRGPISKPANALTEKEKKKMLQIVNSEKYRDVNPHQIVAKLADEGEYVASESSFYRLLRAEKLLAHRSKSKPRTNHPPRCLIATGPNKVWSWDITYLPSTIKGKYYYLYMVEDIFSRLIIGWCVKERECSDIASRLIEKCCIDQSIRRHQIALHSDNGSPMKGATMLATLDRLGVTPSRSRPHVSDDNPFSESLFKTMKYCPQYPSKAFASLQDAETWVKIFSNWYNTEHLHSEIRFVTPHSRHYGTENQILNERDILYKISRNNNPLRWSKNTRNWSPVLEVILNPGKEEKQQNLAINNQ